MKLKAKDLFASLLVAAAVVSYVGYLVEGEMPFAKDPRGMAAVGLLLGFVAFVVLWSGETPDTSNQLELALAVVSIVLGVVTLGLAETAAAEILLAIFMGSILVVWAVKLADHAGVLPMAHPTGTS
jgi:hypothetical protein